MSNPNAYPPFTFPDHQPGDIVTSADIVAIQAAVEAIGNRGSWINAVRSVSANTTVLPDDGLIRVTAASVDVRVTLPPATGIVGTPLMIAKVSGAANVAILPAPTDTINGPNITAAAAIELRTLNAFAYLLVDTDTTWRIVSLGGNVVETTPTATLLPVFPDEEA